MNSAAGLSFTRSPGHYLQIKVRMTVTRNAAIGSRKVARVTAMWTGSGFSSVDAVRAVLKVG